MQTGTMACMKKIIAAASVVPLTFAAPLMAQEEVAPVTPTSVVAEAADSEWLAIAAEDLLVMELAPDAAGNPRTIVIQLMPAPFSQPWVENIRTLARAHWWDGTSVNRVQDDYVTQWGDVTEEKLLPERVVSPMSDYVIAVSELPRTSTLSMSEILENCPGNRDRCTGAELPADAQEQLARIGRSMPRPDLYSEGALFRAGWPVAYTREDATAWPVHCYGYVGVGRGYAPDTGTGADLYTIIGQPQRHMDRNLAVVGRVIDGMQHLSSLPRGSGDLGFYTDEEAHLRTPILSARLASEIVDAPQFEYLDTSSESFARYTHVRANRDDAFYMVPAGGVDVCSVRVPIRQIEE